MGSASMLVESASPPYKRTLPAALEKYKFQPGHAPLGAGRPKGSRDARTIYLESLPLKARQWVKSTAPATLIDARKIALPIESDLPVAASSLLVGFLETQLGAPSSVADPSLIPPQNV